MGGVAPVTGVSRRLRKLDPEEEDDAFHSYEVPAEAKLESCASSGPQRLSFDAATFMESGRRPVVRPGGSPSSAWSCPGFPGRMALVWFQVA